MLRFDPRAVGEDPEFEFGAVLAELVEQPPAVAEQDRHQVDLAGGSGPSRCRQRGDGRSERGAEQIPLVNRPIAVA
jgi:hypothetical protein